MSQALPNKRSNASVAFMAFAVVVGMVALAYASVPLYRLFCQVTGFAGTPQISAAPDATAVGSRLFEIEFDANVSSDLPWTFKPKQRRVEVKVGEPTLVAYEALNPTAFETKGTSTFNVTPLKVGKYFNKVQCFCFQEQELKPGESSDFPVTFFVDPAIVDDPEMADVKEITLSYTFFKLEDG